VDNEIQQLKCLETVKRADFFTCNAPRPGQPKTVAQEIIDQIHELILEDRLPDFEPNQ
jgi:hypothetical protein